MKIFLITISIFLVFLLPNVYADEDEVFLHIDKSDNILFVMLNDTVVYKFNIASGKDARLTPVGNFRIIRKVKNPWFIPKNIPGGDPRNPVGTRWLGLDVPNTNGYKFGIHGTNDPYSIGKHVSQGCIRMKNVDVEWLYRHTPLLTRVVISP
jgi:lipoprotein-anchoring transpeptidase ErfK/SrfK